MTYLALKLNLQISSEKISLIGHSFPRLFKFFPALLFSYLAISLFPSLAFAACAPAVNGDYAVTTDCAFSGTANGVDNGNLTVNQGATLTLNAGQILVINPGKGIAINGSIAINTTAQIKKTYLWMTDVDGDGWPANITQIAQNTAPANGRRRYLMASVATPDCNDAAYSLTNDCGGSGGGVGAWTTTTPLPSAMNYHSVVVNNGFIYSIGGIGGGESSPTTTVYFAPISATNSVGTWKTTTPLPRGLYFHRAVVYNGYIYTTGGKDDAPFTTSTVFYAPISATNSVGAWQTTTELPQPIFAHSAVVNSGFIYTTGGGPVFQDGVVYYAPISATSSVGAWKTTTPLLPVAFHSTVVNNGYIYTMGGTNGTAVTSTVYFAQISATSSVGAWTRTTPLPQAVGYNSAVVNNGFIYVIGGLDSSSTPISAVYSAPISATNSVGAWQTTTQLPTLLGYYSTVANNGFVYIIGGPQIGIGGATSTVYFAPLQ